MKDKEIDLTWDEASEMSRGDFDLEFGKVAYWSKVYDGILISLQQEIQPDGFLCEPLIGIDYYVEDENGLGDDVSLVYEGEFWGLQAA
jgi:hypothetical protein